MFSSCSEEWIDLVFSSAEELLFQRGANEAREETKVELQAIREYVGCLLSGCLLPEWLDRPIVREFTHDILAWARRPGRVRLSEFAVNPPIALRFFFPRESVSVMQDAFRRYGADLPGLAKMMQRVKANLYTRQVRYEAGIEREPAA
jgi:hypothetical protein